ncbi:MAG: hypothetical protein J6F31_01070 [Oscillospiraceae bacterium]|nr:hypothetical protein [Oscillospiraceae bacterium]
MEILIAVIMSLAGVSDVLCDTDMPMPAAECTPAAPDKESAGDILFIPRPEGFTSQSSAYDRVTFEKKWSSSSRLCYRAVKQGKDNIFVSWQNGDTPCCAEYIVEIDEDMNITLADVRYDPPVLY